MYRLWSLGGERAASDALAVSLALAWGLRQRQSLGDCLLYLVESRAAGLFASLGRLLFLRSLFERVILRFFDLRVVNIKTLFLWILLGFLDVRERRPGVFRDNFYWRIGFFVGGHGYWEMSGR